VGSRTHPTKLRIQPSENMKTIPFSTKKINSLNVLTVSAGTNTPCGGDTGHGGRTFFL
jgi:hypothetical protein